MSYIFCTERESALPAEGMEHEIWQVRARNAGLSQKLLSKLAGVSEVAISAQLRGLWKSGTPAYIKAIIRAWEMLTPDQRERLKANMEADNDAL